MATLGLKLRFLYYRLRLLRLGTTQKKWHSVAGNLKMLIDPTDPVDRAFFVGNFAHDLRAYIKSCVQKGDVVLDIGAQKGFITLHLCEAVGPQGQVAAFEPDPRSRKILSENVTFNGVTNVAVYPYALANHDGYSTFVLSGQLGWSGLFTDEFAQRSSTTETTVECRTLDSLWTSGEIKLPQLDFVKMDCQGAEPLILQGMPETLSRFSPALWMEIDHDALRAAGHSAEDVARLLHGFGYSMYRPEVVRGQIDRLPVIPGTDFELLAVRETSPAARRLRAAFRV